MLGIVARFVIAAAVGTAAFIGAVSVIWARVVGPWVAKPLAKAVRHELNEAVEVAFLSSDVLHQHVTEVAQEAVAHELGALLGVVSAHDRRLTRIESDTSFIRSRMAERPARDERPPPPGGR